MCCPTIAYPDSFRITPQIRTLSGIDPDNAPESCLCGTILYAPKKRMEALRYERLPANDTLRERKVSNLQYNQNKSSTRPVGQRRRGSSSPSGVILTIQSAALVIPLSPPQTRLPPSRASAARQALSGSEHLTTWPAMLRSVTALSPAQTPRSNLGEKRLHSEFRCRSIRLCR